MIHRRAYGYLVLDREGQNVSELWRNGAVELAAMIRDREVSSREVVQAHLERIEAVNPHLNAIVRLRADQALAAADAADLAVADGARLGPLHGVPFTVKENIDPAGTPTTPAIPALSSAVRPARRSSRCMASRARSRRTSTWRAPRPRTRSRTWLRRSPRSTPRRWNGCA